MSNLYSVFLFLLAATIVVVATLFFGDFLAEAPHAKEVWQPWLTLIGLVSALFIAVWQQEKISQREADQRKRRSVAARAILPTVLDDIAHYAEDCLEAYAVFGDRVSEIPENTLVQGAVFHSPAIPTSSLQKIQDCIEHADEEHQKDLSELIRKVQIQHSRLRLLEGENSIMGYTLVTSIVDALIIYAWCERLFPYARLESNECVGKLTLHDVTHAARLLRYGDNEEVLAYIGRRFGV